ncbi:MAG: SRPBCC domain-containing protein [Sphingobacteriaceae bacterium]|nr:MAG: SRPBCC domain-containing protein [Sphingobacteriaceae bacterium]
MSNLTVKTDIEFNAPKAEVWKGLTDPGMIKQYFFGTDLKTDWKVGSPVIWSGEWDGKIYEDKGEVLEIIPGEYVKYSYWSSMSGTEDTPENYQQVSYSLKEEGGQTILTITQEGSKDEAAKEHSESNWKALMEELRKMIE